MLALEQAGERALTHMVSHPGTWHFITFIPSFISRSVIVIPHVHALSCKSRAFLTRRCRVPVLELLLGLVGASALVFEGGSKVVARAMVGAVVAAGGGADNGAAVVFVNRDDNHDRGLGLCAAHRCKWCGRDWARVEGRVLGACERGGWGGSCKGCLDLGLNLLG